MTKSVVKEDDIPLKAFKWRAVDEFAILKEDNTIEMHNIDSTSPFMKFHSDVREENVIILKDSQRKAQRKLSGTRILSSLLRCLTLRNRLR